MTTGKSKSGLRAAAVTLGFLIPAPVWAQQPSGGAAAASQPDPAPFDPSARGATPTENTQPAPVPVPEQGSRYYLPGMPPPGGSAGSNPMLEGGAIRSEGKAPANSGTGRGEAIYEASGGETTQEARAEASGPVPEMHLVRKGDTLWDIASTYFRNPYYWPKLWSYNPLITNPHWIYPGDVVRLRPAGGEAAPMAAAPTLPTTRMSRGRQVAVLGLRKQGFVDQGELKAAATIVGSREEKLMLANLDEAYLEYSDDKPLRAGERYSIYRVVADVKRPGSPVALGSVVEIMGETEVRSLGDKHIAKSVITEAENPIERGFRVGRIKQRFDAVEPAPATVSVDGLVLATMRPTELLGEAMLVFVDRGKDDGLAVGNRLQIARRGDGYESARVSGKQIDNNRFPREVMGEVILVEVRKNTSTAVVTRSIKEVAVGDRLEARKGY